MDNSEKETAPESLKKDTDNPDVVEGPKRTSLWGAFFLIIGIGGLAVSIYSGWYDLYNTIPLFGTVVAGVLVAALSILMIAYGYRLMRRDI